MTCFFPCLFLAYPVFSLPPTPFLLPSQITMETSLTDQCQRCFLFSRRLFGWALRSLRRICEICRGLTACGVGCQPPLSQQTRLGYLYPLQAFSQQKMSAFFLCVFALNTVRWVGSSISRAKRIECNAQALLPDCWRCELSLYYDVLLHKHASMSTCISIFSHLPLHTAEYIFSRQKFASLNFKLRIWREPSFFFL